MQNAITQLMPPPMLITKVFTTVPPLISSVSTLITTEPPLIKTDPPLNSTALKVITLKVIVVID